MKKKKMFIVLKGQNTPKYLMVIEGLSSWSEDKNRATRFINERKVLDRLESSQIDNATIQPVYE